MNFAVWRALAGVLTGAICCQIAVKSLRPEMRSSLEAGAVLDGGLSRYLSKIDAAIAAGEYEHAVTLSYTCLEGFYGAFVRARYKQQQYPNEIIELSKEVKNHLKSTIKDYPDEVLNGVTQAAYAVDKARNQFSQSHFAHEAGSWLATYVRDLVNTQIRLLLHFI